MRSRHLQGAQLHGFTLMEMLVTITIIGILAAIAIPSYAVHVERSKRASARSALMAAASFMERSFATNGCYNFASPAACQLQSGTALTLPTSLAGAPSEGRASYVITLNTSGSATGQSYVLTATPCGSAGTCPGGSDPFVDGKCGALTLSHTGARGRTGSHDLATCWQR